MKYKKKPVAIEAFQYVIQGVRGEIYCCKEDIFLETYEPVLERE